LKRLLLSSVIAALAASVASAQNPAPTPALAAGFASLRGVVYDSLHETVLNSALVRVDNTTREIITDASGRYRIDSVPPGEHRLVVTHPLLDTLGISLVTQAIAFNAGEEKVLDLSVPTGE